MHPDLVNNSLFLRYYASWQKDPDSIVFASIADYFLRYGLIDDAYKVCKEGISRHPRLTVGRVVMAKIHFARGNIEEAEEELRLALEITPKNMQAMELMAKLKEAQNGEAQISATDVTQTQISDMPSEWETVTMANIYAQQGHVDKARDIYHHILEKDPQNEEAQVGLSAINSSASAEDPVFVGGGRE